MRDYKALDPLDHDSHIASYNIDVIGTSRQNRRYFLP